MNFASYKNKHSGDTVLVCGCGRSLKQLTNPQNFVTIGVNDVGRLFDPNYLVVLNPRSQFNSDRFKFVQHSAAEALFTQLNLGISHPRVVRFKLGERGGTDVSSDASLPFTRNSPYVAVCLAAYMGAKRIGVIGVDFTDHHFFVKSGRHVLNRQIVSINKEYEALFNALSRQGVELINLSKDSLLTSIPKQSISDFQSQRKMPVEKNDCRAKPPQEAHHMKINIERYRGPLINQFLGQIGQTAQSLGHHVEYHQAPFRLQANIVSVVWNGRRYRNANNVIFCEHGWLPRDAYQVSPGGINADSHIAPFEWDGQVLAKVQREAVRHHLQMLKTNTQGEFAQGYTSTLEPVAKHLPSDFLLVPLQMERDTNIVHHAPPNLRKMQALIDFISRSNPPFPIIFKQHPADQKFKRHLHLRTRRKGDVLRPHSQGNIHQILKSGRCRGIVSLNSNVVHDGFLWDVPSIVLGSNIWPRRGNSPFLLNLPANWDHLSRFYHSQQSTQCREAYLHYLLTQQWTLDDAKDADKVGELLDRKAFQIKKGRKKISLAAVNKRVRARRSNTIRVNVYALNRAWLFEDLKTHFAKLVMPGIKIIVTERPILNADSWVCLRAAEARKSPNKSRTVVQIHDQFEEGLYSRRGKRQVIKNCGAICFTHPMQKTIVERSGLDISSTKTLIKPLGALSCFTPRHSLSDKFTVGWVGRAVIYQGQDFKRIRWLVDALAQWPHRADTAVKLIGEKLERTHSELSALDMDAQYLQRSKCPHSLYPELYKKLDCLVITSAFAAGPNSLFEALASGVPVISTRCGWAEELIKPSQNGVLVDSAKEITDALEIFYKDRDGWLSKSANIAATGVQSSLEDWLQENVRLAISLGSSDSEQRVRRAITKPLSTRQMP